MDDLAVPQHHRSGAHRARRNSLPAVLLSLVLVAVVSGGLLWALLTFGVLGAQDPAGGPVAAPTDAGSAPATQPADAASPGSSADPGAEPGTQPSVPPSAGPTAEPTVGPGPEPSPEPTVDRSVGVDVLNSTDTVGLAAGAAAALEELGWAVGEVTNFDGDEIPTTVLHPTEDLAATADALVADLGTGVTQLSADVDVVTVVLGPDYPG
ncbi:LytR C-terminal domain-containing protein [Aquipuribacter nitratireducens]|uniref:LytR C-terminal domain-containing protein n=1 Tax=Aquipuribacter nitratireducens TaxID=650104 RepID=A0ABW0GM09_9MICO